MLHSGIISQNATSISILLYLLRFRYSYKFSTAILVFHTFGKILRVTAIAIVDELCSAAELVMGKTEKCPVAIIKNYDYESKNGNINSILRNEKEDWFR